MQGVVLAEVLRGDVVESRHQGSVAVVDADGKMVLALGDVGRPIFPRSAIKSFQALPFVESGAPEAFGLDDRHLALACASHDGLPIHTEVVADALRLAGRDVGDLLCGTHWPLSDTASRQLAASGASPCALHNNCSGKHAGFICLACAAGHDPAGYVEAGHPVQREVTDAIEAVTGQSLKDFPRGIDGCSIPAHCVPLRALAAGFARFGTGRGLQPERAAAARRLIGAVQAHPDLIAGPGRFDSQVMRAAGTAIFTKTGAEGVHCASLPALGLGIAVKVDDGARRCAEAVMAGLLSRLLPRETAARELLHGLAAPTYTNWQGLRVGSLRLVDVVSGS